MGVEYWDSFQTSDSTALVLFAGVSVAALAIVANAWSQWQTARISHALQGMQTLRTDREYLINSTTVTQAIAQDPNASWGRALSPALSTQFRDAGQTSTVDAPSFRDASLFLLNQYEFLAAATRAGAIDFDLMRRTLAGPIANLLTTYADEIVHIRQDRPKAFTDLIWLHRTFSGSLKPYLGPVIG